ncbi:uncharacterized protein TRIADDRAFT_52443 [Trichoplax adhaerens]|uniref:mRNA-decapping enzyme C-terminal domain-containing protein n=1 Tax=Trichoplax adhaerens TaxID=10228 RepID=B3RIL0_TRIAD|nr:hypothetical protein TRIADDRAFT_52443 [Trichoplax adhaerens]EDV29737.1 hypothetical protein TRIADDRAFT_52443 [Trichoplax adhaerens]|eukprot:XP_002108939.1 hypothetical protein TRIADDRAFT_52443 [Trichoplax adhaerens]
MGVTNFKKQSDLSDPAIKKASVVRKSIPQMLKSEPVTIPEQSPLSRLFKRHGSQSLIQTNSETGDTEMDSMCSRDTVAFKDSITSMPSNQRFRSSTVPANLNQMVCKSDYNKLLSPKSGEIVNDLCSHIEYNNDGLTFEAIAHLTEDKKNSPGSEDLAVAEGDRNEESDAATEGINYPSLLMSPMVFQRSSVPSETLSDAATPPTQNFSSGIVLTKEQLKNTLIDLLQNDDKFLETINAAYLRHLARD